MEIELDNEGINNRVSALLKKNSVTGYKLCKDLKIPNGSFINMKKGRQNWGLEYLTKIAVYFKVSLDFLVFGGNNAVENSSKVANKIREYEEELLILREKDVQYGKFIDTIKKNMPREK